MHVGGGRAAEEKRPLLEPYRPRGANKDLRRCRSHADDELRSFRWWLRWMCVDQSDAWRAALSWAMFLGLGAAVPMVSHFVLVVDSDTEGRRRHASYDAVVQLSLTSVAAVSFFCLSAFVRRYGLRRFLFLDKLCGESETVRRGYTAQLNLCSIGLVTGILICLRSATKITHKAQAITSHAAKWHVCCTVDSFDTETAETTPTLAPSDRQSHPLDIINVTESDCDDEDVDVDDEDLEDTKLVQPHANTISFQKRQALVMYLENNRAGITFFGFTIDRSWLHMMFGVEFPLVLWLLGKTVGIS